MERVDRPTLQSSAADLADAFKSRSSSDAAAELAGFSGPEIAAALMQLVPLTLKRLGFDPAAASSIFLTTATDVVSMGMLLGLATMMVR